jgi:AcrR family transcriptional regulator
MTRTPPDVRTDSLLTVALSLAARHGWRTLTHDAVADAAGVSRGLVVARLGTKTDMLRSVMRAAVRDRCARVVAEGLALRHPAALRADAELRNAAAEAVRLA